MCNLKARTLFPVSIMACLVVLTTAPGCGRGDRGRAGNANQAPDGVAAERPPLPAPLQNPPGRDPAAAADEPQESDPLAAEPKTPLVRGLSGLLGSHPLIEEDAEFQDSLLQADSILQEMKDENAQALREVNRQTITGSSAVPNLILILADGLGYGDLGCCGQERIRTPQLDRLASEGMAFSDFHAGGLTSEATRWSLMTGADASRARAGNQLAYVLQAEQSTLAEVIWQAGYETVFVGHWALPDNGASSQPHLHGFDRWLGTLSADPLQQAFPQQIWSNGAKIKLPANDGGQRSVYLGDLYTQEVLEFLNDRRGKRPFLLVLAYGIPGPRPAVPSLAAYQDRGWTETQSAFAAAITRLDEDIGSIRAQLSRTGLDRRTAVFFTSDCGPSDDPDGVRKFFASNSILKLQKDSLYEGSLRVPFLASWPGRFPAGQVSDYPAAIWDLLPTFADLASAMRRPGNIDGVSLAPILFGKEGKPRGMLYWEIRQPGFSQAVRQGDWKVVRPAGKMQREEVELYNLRDDPGETTNVAPQYPKIVAEFIKG